MRGRVEIVYGLVVIRNKSCTNSIKQLVKLGPEIWTIEKIGLI